jgi:2-polyprenyl-6-methoxyphenol hydroxylase-like FAD-dependent oxidoreductase
LGLDSTTSVAAPLGRAPAFRYDRVVTDARTIEEKYDIVIVGGRPAGASLAARLGAGGARVLVIDKAELSTPPAVPSCPQISPAAMELLDETGLEERAYGAGSVKVHALLIELRDICTGSFEVPVTHGRDYVYSIDRVRFDGALWQHLSRFPSVTARSSVAFVDLVRDERGRAIGVDLREGDGPLRRVLADVVVGADGRFSAVARKAEARVVEDFPDRTSTVYFADWEGFPPVGGRPDPVVFIHATGRGFNILHFPMEGGRTVIATHQRADRVRVEGDAQGYYEAMLRSQPLERRRLQGARQVSPVIGLKRIANRYLEFGGPGWVLVGDAVHCKDPLDGQGIYDALVEAKILARLLLDVRAGTRTFGEALTLYRERALAATHGMFLATVDRLKRELYEEPPEIVMRTLMRWLLTDPEYQRRFILCFDRVIPPETWLPPSLVRAVALRGVMGDLRRLLGSPGAVTARRTS